MQRAHRLWVLTLIALSALAALFLVIYPMMIVQPFKRQDPVQLQHALYVFRIAPNATLALAVVAFLASVFVWRTARVVCSILLVLTGLSAVLARINVFEQMFHPAGSPRFLAIQDTRIEPDDMVIAVALNGQAHAFPIREMAYHHVVNDWVGSIPVVATY